MSRGFGRIQRTVLATLQAHGGNLDVATLLQEQAVATDPDRAKPWYRAITRLEQVGVVWATWLPAPGHGRPVGRTKRLHLVQPPFGQETPLVVLRGGVPDTTVQVTNRQWSTWARSAAYTPRYRVTVAGPRPPMTLELWARTRPDDPYLVLLPLLPNGQGGVLTRCATRMEAELLFAQSIDVTCQVLAGVAPALVACQHQEMTP